jgi:hypothetical protein
MYSEKRLLDHKQSFKGKSGEGSKEESCKESFAFLTVCLNNPGGNVCINIDGKGHSYEISDLIRWK